MLNAAPATPTSEMVGRVRAFDWAATPLGPIEAWPQSLRIAVGICLSSRFPMFVWWGRERINIYNDAYVPILGAKHPEALGRPAEPTWREIWDVVGPQAEAVFERGEATWNERVVLMMKRHGFEEETFFTWSYSPIWDESGAVGGLFCACYEETGRVLAERDRDRLLAQVESERARLADAFAQSPSFMAILRGRDLVFEYVNERFLRMVGGRHLLGKPVRKALPEVEGQGFFEILDRVFATGEPFAGTGMRIMLQRHPDRPLEPAYVDFVYLALRGSGGEVAGILCHGVEVTQRHRAEARDRFLLGLEDSLRPLSEPAEIAAVVARLVGTHMEVSRCAYSDLEPDGEHFEVVADYSRGVPSAVGRYRLADFGVEVVASMSDNRAFIVEDVDTHRPPLDPAPYRRLQVQSMIAVPLHKGGRFTAAMAVHDTRPRHWTDADVELLLHVASRCYESMERARTERALRESGERFRQLADAMPQIVFAADGNGTVIYYNRQWYAYTGLAEGESGPESWKLAMRAEDLERVEAKWRESVRTGAPFEMEYPIRRHDGKYRWQLARAVPIRDERGNTVRWFGTNTDIHDRKKIEQALAHALRLEQQARGEAEMASRMKDEFLATLSHELRTPLNAILGWAHMMRRDGATAGELSRGAEVIERNARAQSAIIEDLLDMSAIVSGKVRLERRPVDLAVIVAAAVESAGPAAEAKGIRIRSRIDPDVGTVSADANRLQQVLWNLLTNAVKFTPPEGRVDVAARATDGHVRIAVTDTGEGIAPEFLPHVFDRFRQADASTTRRHGGLGLGLSIVKHLVELHGGAVSVASDGRGKGACFTVTLPLDEARAGWPAVRERPGEGHFAVPAEDRARIEGKSILVVDDEPDARELVKQLLEQCRARVTTADSSGEALRLFRERRFDVLVSDIAMPGMDGHELMRTVRALAPEHNGRIPAVALTAYARPEDRMNAIRAGFQMHATKPIEPAELIAMVASLSREA